MAVSRFSNSRIGAGFPKYQNFWDQTTAIVGTSTVDVFGDGSGIALWRFENNANDTSNNYNGTASNVTYSSTDYKLDSYSAVFNGSSSNISIPSVKSTYPVAISAWVKSNTGFQPTSGVEEIINMSVATYRLTIGWVTNSPWPQGPTVMYGNSNHWSGPNPSGMSGNTTTWYHVVYSIPSYNGTPSVWINGTSVTMTNNGGGHGGTAGWAIGSNGNGGEWWNGKIDQLRFFNRELTQANVNTLYNGGVGI
jgi:hypothetical protein